MKDKKREHAVTRILAGETTPEREAQHLGVSARQIRRWVEAHKKVSGKMSGQMSEKVMSEDVHPPEGTSGNVPPAPETPLKKAMDAAADTSAKPAAPAPAPGPTKAEELQALADLGNSCVTQVQSIQMFLGVTLVKSRYSPPLELSDPAVIAAMKLDPAVEAVVRANAVECQKLLGVLLQGKYQLFGGLVVGALVMMNGLERLAVRHGWEDPRRPGAPRRPAGFDFGAGRRAQADLEENLRHAPHSEGDGKTRQVNAPLPKDVA